MTALIVDITVTNAFKIHSVVSEMEHAHDHTVSLSAKNHKELTHQLYTEWPFADCSTS
jgi:hypothetical protein